MNHCGTVPLETDRLILRRFQESDAPAFFRNVNSDSRVNRYLTRKLHENLAETEALQKVGMQKEGVLRQAGRNNQGLFDLVFYAKLKQDR